MTDGQTQQRAHCQSRFGRWAKTVSSTLVLAFLGTQGIAALPSGIATSHLSYDAGSGLNIQNPFNYALYSFGDFTAGEGEGQHSSGALAIGGNANFSNYSFAGTGNTAPAELGLPQLVVGGELNFKTMYTIRGDVQVKSMANVHGGVYEFAQTTYGFKEGVKLDFSSKRDSMLNRADMLKDYASSKANAVEKKSGDGGWTMVQLSTPNGFDSSKDVLVYNMTSRVDELYVPEGVSVVINMNGSEVNHFPMLRYGAIGSGSCPNDAGDNRDAKVLWNCAEATTVNVQDNFSLHGSLLAPRAHVVKKGGNSNGSIVCSSYFGTSEFHWVPNRIDFTFFKSTPTPTPVTPTDTPTPTPTNTPTPVPPTDTPTPTPTNTPTPVPPTDTPTPT
ncbi:MAG: choice-of-anchor A family protein, partial [Clostridiales bacterium]|nr:choice-of-anchor A family protein [Clostridiales bacterium]